MYKTFPHLFVLLLAFLLTVPYDLTAKPFEIPRSEIVELEDSKTKRVYPIYIKLPPSYHRMANNRYPVIYITDANYAFQIISGATRFPMNSGKMQQAILVGISYSKDSRGDRSRIRDFTPVYAKSWKKTTGEAENHMRFIREQVFNFIDNHYRTAPTSVFSLATLWEGCLAHIFS